MNLKPIKNKTHYNRALERINELWGAKRNTEKGDELDEKTRGIDVAHFWDIHP